VKPIPSQFLLIPKFKYPPNITKRNRGCALWGDISPSSWAFPAASGPWRSHIVKRKVHLEDLRQLLNRRRITLLWHLLNCFQYWHVLAPKSQCSSCSVCTTWGWLKTLVPLVNIKIAGKWMFIPLKCIYRYWPIPMFCLHHIGTYCHHPSGAPRCTSAFRWSKSLPHSPVALGLPAVGVDQHTLGHCWGWLEKGGSNEINDIIYIYIWYKRQELRKSEDSSLALLQLTFKDASEHSEQCPPCRQVASTVLFTGSPLALVDAAIGPREGALAMLHVTLLR